MKCLIIILGNLILLAGISSGQEYLVPSEGFKSFIVLPGSTAGAFDLQGDLLYANDGDRIYCFSLETGAQLYTLELPGDYKDAFPSFITLTADGSALWAGFTVTGNLDDRIYSIDLKTKKWELQAIFPGNYDLEFWNDLPLVSGLNSIDWNVPGSIFVLDTSGLDQHRKIFEPGGYAAGFALDKGGNLYYGSAYATDPNVLLKWDSTEVASALSGPGTGALKPEDAERLCDLPGLAGDCEVDAGGNLIASVNQFSSEKMIIRWNGEPGEGYHFDTLCTASGPGDWLGMVKSQGSINSPSPGNLIITSSPGQAISEVHRDYLPLLTRPFPALSGRTSSGKHTLHLEDYFTDPDDPDAFSFEIVAISNPAVAEVTISGQEMVTDFVSAGQSNVVLKSSNAGSYRIEKLVVGVQPLLDGNYILADFEDLSLAGDSFWNGADGSGQFSSGQVNFHNSYNPDWLSWSGWAYSNQTDNVTAGWMNQYSAITGTGFGNGEFNGGNYGVGYVFAPPVIDFTDTVAHQVAGLMVTNSTYAAISMEEGDAFSKKFGGDEGTDPDYLKLLIWGHLHGTSTDTIAFYLADYRFENDTMDYIIKTWQWVDLGSLGPVDTLLFNLESSDVGEWGMNTPGFFCIDHLCVIPDEAPLESRSMSTAPDPGWLVYPNPGRGMFQIRSENRQKMAIRVFNMHGTCLFEDLAHGSGSVIDLTGQPAGNYLITISLEEGIFSKMVQKF